MNKILLAEDERIVALALTTGLKNLGYLMLNSVNSGKDLIESAITGRPDIIVTDIHLKDNISGLDAINTIRKDVNSFFIVITGYNDPDTLAKIRKVSPDALLLKPTSAAQINQVIKGNLQDQTLHTGLQD